MIVQTKSISSEDWQVAWSNLEEALGTSFPSLRATCPMTKSFTKDINFFCEAILMRRTDAEA